MTMPIQYKNPPTNPSTMGKQHQPHFYYKKALIETFDPNKRNQIYFDYA